MAIAAHSFGTGPDLVLLHGWALSSSVWNDVAASLATHYRVTLIDLPGHGNSPPAGSSCLANWAALVAAVAPPQATWLGWSLGGMVAMEVALRTPGRVTALILTGTTPRFVRDADWAHAVSPDVLFNFGRELEIRYAETLQRFLTLQVRGTERERVDLHALRALAFAPGTPQPQGLAEGLEILHSADLRSGLPHINCPVLVVAGSRDALVPLAAAQALVLLLSDARLDVMAAAGHAPFLSHPRQFTALVKNFLNEHRQPLTEQSTSSG